MSKSKKYLQEVSSKNALRALGITASIATVGGMMGKAAEHKRMNDMVQDKIIPQVAKTGYEKGITSGLVLGTVGAGVSIVARNIISDAMKLRTLSKCEDIEDKIDRQYCYDKINKNILDKLRKNMFACEKSKDPEECKKLVNIKIEKIINKSK